MIEPTALQGGAPSGGILFLFVKKEYGERHSKEPMVLWKLLHYAADAFALTNRCQTNSHWCLARILISGGVPEYPKGISSGGTLCHLRALRPICSTEGKYRSTP